MMMSRWSLSAAILLFSGPALAAADLSLSLAPPAGVHVYQSGRYNLTVNNLGNKNAGSVNLTIQLPVTGTSPTVYVLGNLGGRDTRCNVSGTRLLCALGSIGAHASKTVYFDLALPYAAKTLAVDASVTTTSTESTLTNNSLHRVISPLTYPVTLSTPQQAVLNRHCTGTPSLSSFFECELFPSSIMSHQTVLHSNGTITFVNAPATYTGTWTQPTPDHLQIQYFDGATQVVEFDGYGVSGACFEGRTDFPNTTGTYISIYQVCKQ